MIVLIIGGLIARIFSFIDWSWWVIILYPLGFHIAFSMIVDIYESFSRGKFPIILIFLLGIIGSLSVLFGMPWFLKNSLQFNDWLFGLFK